ncbi:hypothetical protein CHUAL_008591 [Chamberlinius hualienensis]
MDGDNADCINIENTETEEKRDIEKDEERLTSNIPKNDDSSAFSSGNSSDNESSSSTVESSTCKSEPEQREPVKIHIKLTDLKRFRNSSAYTRKRKPKWYCYQCRITFFGSIHFERHLNDHVKETKVNVSLVRLPLPEEVVSEALKRYKAAELLKTIKAELQAEREIEQNSEVESEVATSVVASVTLPLLSNSTSAVEINQISPNLPEFQGDEVSHGVPEVVSVENTVSVPLENFVSIPTENIVSVSSENIVSVSSEATVAVPSETTVVVPSENTVTVPFENTVTVSLDNTVAVPLKNIVAVPFENIVAVPLENIVAVPLEKPVSASLEPPSSVGSRIEFTAPHKVTLLENKMINSSQSPSSSNLISEPERCQSVMIIENESSATCLPKILTTKISNTSLPPALLSQIDPSRRFSGGNGPNMLPPQTMQRPPNSLQRPSMIQQPPQLRPSPIQHLASQMQQTTPRIQEVVSLARRQPALLHVDRDPDSTCSCSGCMEIRCGDLLRKSQYPIGNGQIGYQCVTCGGKYAGKNQLLRHCRFAKHSFLCELCGSGFLKEDLFRLHSKLHLAKQQSASGKHLKPTVIFPSTSLATTSTNSPAIHPQTMRSVDMIRTPLSKFSTPAARNSNGLMQNGKNMSAAANLQAMSATVRTMPKVSNDDEVVVLGEKRQLSLSPQRHQRPNPNLVGSPTQLSRILHNSEITLTPINTTTASISNDNGNGNGNMSNGQNSVSMSSNIANVVDRNNSQLYQHLKKPTVPNVSTVVPPSFVNSTSTSTANINVSLPIGIGNQSVDPRKTISSGGHLLSQNRPILSQSNVYRMMPLTNNIRPPPPPPNLATSQLRQLHPNPMWHHPVTAAAAHSMASAASTSARPIYSLGNGARYPLPASLLTAARQINLNKITEINPPNRFPFNTPNSVPGVNPVLPSQPRIVNIVKNGLDSSGPTRAPPPAVAPVRCHVCNLIFHSIVSFQNHFDMTHKSQYTPTHFNYKCQRCGKSYNQLVNYKRHEAICSEKILCSKCNQYFYRHELLVHYNRAHPNTSFPPFNSNTSTAAAVAVIKHRLIKPKPTELPPPPPYQPPAVSLPPKPSQVLNEINQQTLPAPDIDIEVINEIPSNAMLQKELQKPDITIAPIASTSSSAAETRELIVFEIEPEPSKTANEDSSASAITQDPSTSSSSPATETTTENNSLSVAEQSVIASEDVESGTQVTSSEEITNNSLDSEVDVEAVDSAEIPAVDVSVDIEDQSGTCAALENAEEVGENVDEENVDVENLDVENVDVTSVFEEVKEVDVEMKSVSEEVKEVDVEMKSVSEEVKEVDFEMKCVSEEVKEVDVEMKSVAADGDSVNVSSCCPVCDQTFEDQETLQSHLQIHCETNIIKKYNCTFCQKEFDGSSKLSMHLRTHFTSCKRSPTKSPSSLSPNKKRKLNHHPNIKPISSEVAMASNKNGVDCDLKDCSNLAVAILDLNKLSASMEVLRKLGVVDFISLKQLKSYLLNENATDKLSFTKLL